MSDCSCSCGMESTIFVCNFWSQKGGSLSWLFLFLLLSLIFEINEGRSLMADVTVCHRKLWSWEVKSWASLKEMGFLCGISLTPYFFFQNNFNLLPVVFSLFFCSFSFLSSISFFYIFFSSYAALCFSFSLSISFLSISMTYLMSFHLASPSSFTCFHLRWSCEARDILFSSLWT